ncbi:MAG: response regulator [Verrucomicrobiia bacterium]
MGLFGSWFGKGETKEENSSKREAEVPEGGSGVRFRALLIDDDEQLLRLLTTAMERSLGPEIVTARDGAEAIGYLERENFDLIISDFALPQVSGWQLFFWIAKNRPELVQRFLLISGALGDDAEAQAIENMGIKVLRKPFPLARFLEACEEVLQGANVQGG